MITLASSLLNTLTCPKPTQEGRADTVWEGSEHSIFCFLFVIKKFSVSRYTPLILLLFYFLLLPSSCSSRTITFTLLPCFVSCINRPDP